MKRANGQFYFLMTKRANRVPESEYQVNKPTDFSQRQPDPENLLELWTLEGDTFKKLIATLKAVLTEGNLEFTDKGMKLAAVDINSYALVHLKIDASSFQFYHCPQKLTLGVYIEHLSRSISTNKMNDPMCMIVTKSDPTKLKILYDNPEKPKRTIDKIKLLSLQQYNIFDKIEYSPACVIDSREFEDICRDMCHFGATLVDIQSIGNELIFENTDGDIIRRKVFDVSPLENAAEIPPARGVFLLKFLKSFAKAANVGKKVRLYLKNDAPLTCEYDVSGLGKLMFLLSYEKNKK